MLFIFPLLYIKQMFFLFMIPHEHLFVNGIFFEFSQTFQLIYILFTLINFRINLQQGKRETLLRSITLHIILKKAKKKLVCFWHKADDKNKKSKVKFIISS